MAAKSFNIDQLQRKVKDFGSSDSWFPLKSLSSDAPFILLTRIGSQRLLKKANAISPGLLEYAPSKESSKELSRVALVKDKRGHLPVSQALDLVDFKKAIAGWDVVLIKVNFITTKTWDTGATTDPIVVEGIIKRLRDLPVQVYVVESDATMTNADRAFEMTGMQEMCTRYDVECLNLRHEKDRVKITVPDGEVLKSVKVPRLVSESAIISAAKLKTHRSTIVTLGMKNMFGLLPDKFKSKYHFRDISKVIVDVNTVLRPVLTVIDGFVGMEGRGPVGGSPVQMDLVIAGDDVVATDSVGCRVMGFDPHTIKHIQMAHEKNLGRIDDLELVGERLEHVMRAFKHPRR